MKTRSDSLWAKLRPEQREELFGYLDAGGAIADGLALLKTWGIKSSAGALSRCYSLQSFAWRLERARLAAEAARGCLPENFEEAKRKIVAQKIFEMVANSEANPKNVIAVRKLEIEQEKLQLAERRVHILEQNMAEAKRKLEGIKSKGGLTKETLAQIEEAAGLL